MLSDVEGGPATISESLISGVIVLATEVGIALDIITDGLNGFIIKNNEYDDIISKIELLRTNSEICQKISNNAIAYAQKNLSYRTTFKPFDQMFSEALSLESDGRNLAQLINFFDTIKK